MKTEIELNEDQKKAREAIIEFWKRRDLLLTFGGFAGTGKTTLIAHVVETMRNENKKLRVAFCALTGKASAVLLRKLIEKDVLSPESYCGTIHSLIYRPIIIDGQIKGFNLRTALEFDLIIADEASMINEQVFHDLSSFGIPIIAAGDHGQLPPVMSNFNLMERPNIRLEKIMRQAEGDPIIRLSMIARETGRIPVGIYSDEVRKVTDRSAIEGVDFRNALILCAKNKTRVKVNHYARRRIGYLSVLPSRGEKVICLKNNRGVGIYNGSTGVIESIRKHKEHWFSVAVKMDGESNFAGLCFRHQFGSEKPILEFPNVEPEEIGDLFDWAYCMTVHKAQGSEAADVVVLEERMSFMSDDDWRRWLYTAVTRSQKKLLIIE